MQDVKMIDMKMTDQIAGHENAGHGNAGLENTRSCKPRKHKQVVHKEMSAAQTRQPVAIRLINDCSIKTFLLKLPGDSCYCGYRLQICHADIHYGDAGLQLTF